MADRLRIYRGRPYKDPGGYLYEPRCWWEDDPLLNVKPWHVALFWKYLVYLAVWDPRGRKVRRGGAIVDLERGQLYHSLRWLGTRPGWAKDRVARELALLEDDGRIRVEARQGGTVVTIVGYDPWQDPAFYAETPPSGNNACKPEKRDAERYRSQDRASGLNPPDVNPVLAHAPRQDPRQEARHGRDSDETVLMKSGEEREDARARGATPQAAPARSDKPDPDRPTWRSIIAACKFEFWFRAPDIARADMIATALQQGPPPDDLPADVRKDALELGFVLPEPEPAPETETAAEDPGSAERTWSVPGANADLKRRLALASEPPDPYDALRERFRSLAAKETS